ncbi:uncharacterized protein [Nicotiana tomentosiformis]|uniref:uncharacterized protein isoform X1 n=1 Tax=Nicotiana tomentosiformis TaxID=4098 RepID=UPI00388C794B
MAPPEIDGRGEKKLEEESSNGVGSNVADSDSDSDHDYGMYVDGRSMSRKLREEYNRQVDESEGFDINLDLPLGVRMVAPINPQRGFENIPRYTELSRMAIGDFNSQNNKRYEFVKNLTVNTSLAAGFWCRITFQARDADASDAVKTFQTLAWWGIDGDKEVIFCRLKKQSSGEGTLLGAMVKLPLCDLYITGSSVEAATNACIRVVSGLLIPMLM